MKPWLIHTVVFFAAQIVFAIIGFSWPWEVLNGRLPVNSVFASIDDQLWVANTSRIWSIVWLADTGISLLGRRAPKQTADPE